MRCDIIKKNVGWLAHAGCLTYQWNLQTKMFEESDGILMDIAWLAAMENLPWSKSIL